MTPPDRKKSHSPGNRQPRRPLTSRVSTIFSGKASHINDQSIELDEPLRLYGPGETVKGKLVLDVARPLGVTHIVLCLYGYSQVYKNYNGARVGVKNSSGRVVTTREKRWVSGYHGDGFATLFEKEIVLCGEGRLDPRLYHFRFAIDFPDDPNLPTAIEFERGTVSYSLTATVTRPTTISPTSSCEHKVLYRQAVDVATLPEPKARIVTLEPLVRGTKSGSSLKKLTSHDGSRVSHLSSRTRSDRSNGTTNSYPSRVDDLSPRPISPSMKSSRSNSTNDHAPSIHTTAETTSDQSGQSGQSGQSNSRRESDDGKIITAAVQLSRSGYLPGETVTVKVRIDHSKVVHAVDGMVVTLYRQARVDMHPTIAGQSKSDDYYPRSRTGLGGLSLSTAGSSQTWRKDLSQTTAPLYIDPQTLSAEVKVAVVVPDEAFPSIRGVPGDMISFNYYVEVVIDIHGKLSNSNTNFPNLDITAPQRTYGGAEMLKKPGELNSSAPMLSGTNCVDTTQKRRDKSTICCECGLVVGTKDSEKARGKQRVIEHDSNGVELGFSAIDLRQQAVINSNNSNNRRRVNSVESRMSPEGQSQYQEGRLQPPLPWQEQVDYYDYEYDEDGYYNEYDYEYNYRNGYDLNYDYGDEQGYVDPNGVNGHASRGNGFDERPPYRPPPPHLMEARGARNEENLSEKERLRRAEASLLPSAPPGAEEDEAEDVGSHASEMPSAPFLPNEQDFESNEAYREAVARHHDYMNYASHLPMPPPLQRLATSTSTITPSSTAVEDIASANEFHTIDSPQHPYGRGGVALPTANHSSLRVGEANAGGQHRPPTRQPSSTALSSTGVRRFQEHEEDEEEEEDDDDDEIIHTDSSRNTLPPRYER